MKRQDLISGLWAIVIGLAGCSGSQTGAPGDGNNGNAGSAGSSTTAAGGSGGSAGCTTNRDCSVGVCDAGACKEVSCVPNTQFCGDGGVHTCNSDGTPGALVQHCSPTQFCLESGASASCNTTACVPGDHLCNGSVATTCESDGSGPNPGGDDCSLKKQLCFAGQCLDPLCTPGQKLCDAGVLYLCGNGGTARQTITTCDSFQVCDQAQGACVPKLCDTGKLYCDSTRIVGCNTTGDAYVQMGTDCASTNQACVDGACASIVCSPNQRYCKDNTVYTCNNDGTANTTSETCSFGQLCMGGNGSAYCNAPSCMPGQVMCQGSVPSTCAPDGSGFVQSGPDCTLTAQACLNGQCVAQVCSPGSSFCKDNNIQTCDGEGASFSQGQFCGAQLHCIAASSAGFCVPLPCAAGVTSCVGEKLGVCAADGLSVTSATDCSATHQVCTPQGCAASVTDVAASATDIDETEAAQFVGDLVSVDTPRKLDQVTANLTAPVGRKLLWSVYVETDANFAGEFDLDFQVTTAASGAGTESSGPLGVELEAGKVYAIGVASNDGGFALYVDSPTSPQTLSFGHVVGSTSADTGSSISASLGFGELVYALKLTTAAP